MSFLTDFKAVVGALVEHQALPVFQANTGPEAALNLAPVVLVVSALRYVAAETLTGAGGSKRQAEIEVLACSRDGAGTELALMGLEGALSALKLAQAQLAPSLILKPGEATVEDHGPVEGAQGGVWWIHSLTVPAHSLST